MIHPSMLVRIVLCMKGTNGVTLKGPARDTDGDRLSYSWEQASGESAVLSDANTVKPKFNAPDVNGDTVLLFKLTVSDGKVNGSLMM